MARICIWGDSITWGATDHEKEGWANRLRHYFYNESDEDLSVYNVGISGDNSDDLMKRFEVECIAREPDVIIFAIGTNDSQYVESKDNPRVSLKKYEENLQNLIDIAKKHSTKIGFIGLTKVVENKVMPIPWSPTKYYDNENVKLYDDKLKEVVSKNNLPYLYMFDLLEDEELEDGLHPNSNGHEKMFQRIKTFLIENNLK